jgi:glycosyltransferase involved in cell wall biosynthesis
MRIAQMIKGLGRGGAESLLPQLVRGRAADVSYAVGYFVPEKNALVGELVALGVPVRCFGGASALGMLLAMPRVLGWLRSLRPDVLHAHLPLAGVVARLAGRLAGVPVVYTEHNLQERYHPWTRRANAATWRLQRHVLAVSRDVAESIRRHLGEAVPVRVIENGIEIGANLTAAEVASARSMLGFGGAPVVGTVAVMRRQKRLDLWLEVAARVAEDVPGARFLVVGDGPERASVEEQVERLCLGGRVVLPGLQSDVRRFLAAMDVFLMSSEFEGLPLALLEAMALERAPVVTAVGGMRDVVEPGSTGELIPFGDVAGLAAAVVALLRDPDRRELVGARARRRVEERYGIRRMAREVEAVYRETAAGSGSG